MHNGNRNWKLPRETNLHLLKIANEAGLSVSTFANGCLFAIEHESGDHKVMINQVLGSSVFGGISRIYLRAGGEAPLCAGIMGPGAKVEFATTDDCFIWQGETDGFSHRVSLWLHPQHTAWLWDVEIANLAQDGRGADVVLIQDIGLGERGFLMNNEAYASQYIDHHIARHGRYGPVVMCRQNLLQGGRNPWVAYGCLEGAASFATDGLQLFGPDYRDSGIFGFPFGKPLPGTRLQHELACIGIQSAPAVLPKGAVARWQFFGLFNKDHRAASSDSDLALADAVEWQDREHASIPSRPKIHGLVQNATTALTQSIGPGDFDQLYPSRCHEERAGADLLSFFAPDSPLNRHVVLSSKECLMVRRHGTILRSGQAMLPDEATLCVTCWMHGVFAAQLTIGNTSLHKFFSVSRDPYNITRANGLRMMVDLGRGFELLAVPSVFEMGLSDCRWIYRLGERMIFVRATVSGDDPAIEWRITVDGEPCRFLIYGHLAGGERELESDAFVEVDTPSKTISLRPGQDSLWGQHYPQAVYHFVTSTPDAVDAIGGEELLCTDRSASGGAYLALRTKAVRAFCFAVTGSLTDGVEATRLAAKYAQATSSFADTESFWAHVTCGFKIEGQGSQGAALDTAFPWLAQNAMIHLTVPHGLEQYTGAAWGTRDVCQGPVELLLALEHDAPVKEILRIVFAQQYEKTADWPQWFMLEPYQAIQDRVSHGDVIIWPLKALCDYVEATGDTLFLNERVAWRREDNFEPTAHKDTIAEHVRRLLATVRARFIAGTHLIRYGEGDWNDSLQPADPKLRDWMVSSWTVALLFQQLNRYAFVLKRAERPEEAHELFALAEAVKQDFNRYLVSAGTVAGYALFDPTRSAPELLLHPSDTRTGLYYSLLPMTRAIIAGLFTKEQTVHHLRLIREHLLFPDGAHLIDRPIAYRGGPQRIFRRAESAAFFGREIGLMYVHAHLRFAEALAVLEDAQAFWDALMLANPIAVTDELSQARLRQRNAYFSSSDAAFPDRYAASADWERVKEGAVGFEGGWRIYSSGPGIYVSLLVRHVLGRQRQWGKRVARPLLPNAAQGLGA